MATASLRIRTLTDQLGALLLQVDPNMQAAGGEIDAANPTFTIAEGAYFNWRLAQERGEDNADPVRKVAASTVHNPFLMESLLRASINAVRAQYGLKPIVGPTATTTTTNRYAHN